MADHLCAQGRVSILVGDCRERLREMEADSLDACVTDPPYGLTFMGSGWDSGVPPVEVWCEVYRALKPGAHLLAFSGTRTYHRMVCAIEDAGFEIRDQIGWAYGSGFPKSLDVAKAIDKTQGTPGGVTPQGKPVKRIIPGADQNRTGSWLKDNGRTYQPGEYVPGSSEAAEWQGWGTALKPAWEPICVARKPLSESSVAANVLKHGTGAVNIDGCRVPGGERPAREIDPKPSANGAVYAGRREAGHGFDGGSRAVGVTTQGRWPANLIHDGSDEVLACFPDAPGQQRAVGPWHGAKTSKNCYGNYGARDAFVPRSDAGSAARFFYCAKASAAERGAANNHPTVKPLALMRYFVRLVTPPGGTVLDPFAGSGTTGLAAAGQGFRSILIEQSEDYAKIARDRIAAEWREKPEPEREPDFGPLFKGAAE